MGLTAGMVCSDWLVILVGVAIIALGPATLTMSWTDYNVDTDSLLGKMVRARGVAGDSSGNELEQLYIRWPQMFYKRQVQLHQICFPRINETIWNSVFHRPTKYCKTGSKGGTSVSICFCLTVDEYARPVNGTSFEPSDDQQTLCTLYTTAFFCVIIVCACNILVTFGVFRINSSPIVVGILGLILVIIEVCAMPVGLILYFPIENLESSLALPPHLGFIHTNKDINDATTASRMHGFNMCCAMVAIVPLGFGLYLWSFLPRRGKPDQFLMLLGLVSEKTPASDREMTAVGPPQYGESEKFMT